MAAPSHSKILILDFGAQYTQLIARRLRETHVYCEIHPYDVDDDFVRDVRAEGHHPLRRSQQRDRRRHAARARRGVDAGRARARHLLRHADDGRAAGRHGRDRQGARVRLRGSARARPLGAALRDLQDRTNAEGHGLLDVWMSHGDKVTALPPGFRLIGSSTRVRDRGDGRRVAPLLRRAVPSRGHAHEAGRGAARALRARDLRLRQRLEHARLRAARRSRPSARRPATRTCCSGLSGGVDSSVAAALIHRAIGDRLTCVFVDHGLLRLNEAEQVMHTFAQNLGVRVIHVDASGEFLAALAGVDRSRAEAPHHRPPVRRRVPARGREARQREVARAGHHLSRRDRVGRRQDQEGAHDQVASQRRAACRRRCT